MSKTYTSTIETRFSANILNFEKEIKRMSSLNERAAKRVQQDHLKASTGVSSAWKNAKFSDALKAQTAGVDSLSASLKRLAPAIAAAFSAGYVNNAAQSYVRFTNSLKVAGLEGAELASVQEALFQINQKSYQPLEALSGLYGRVAQSAGDLGLTQAEIVTLTESVANGLLVSGTSSAAAAGGLTQLGQALGAGKVAAEEFNSINDSMPGLLLAIVKNTDRFGGSVAKLKKEIIDGKISSREFAMMIIEANKTLQDQASKTALTQDQALTKLSGAITKFIGEQDKSLGISQKIAAVIVLIADNVDLLAAALVVAAGIIGVRMVAAMTAYAISTVSSTAATIAFAAALKGIPVAAAAGQAALIGLRGAGTALLGVFGGPIGLAITGIAVAVGAAGVAAVKYQTDVKSLEQSVEDYEAAQELANQTAGQFKNDTQIPDATLKKVAALTGEVKLLADEYGRAAVAAKALHIQELQTAATQATKKRQLAQTRFEEAQRKIAPNREVSISATGHATVYNRTPSQAEKAALGNDKRTNDLLIARKIEQEAIAEWTKSEKKSAWDFDPRKSASGSASPDKKGKGSKSADQTDQAIRDAKLINLSLALAGAKTEEDRHKIRLETLEYERQNVLAEIDKNKNIKDEAKANLIAAKNAEFDAKISDEKKAYAEHQAQQDRYISDALADTLGIQINIAQTAKERYELSKQALAIEHKNNLEAIERNQALDESTKAIIAQTEVEKHNLKLKQEESRYLDESLNEKREAMRLDHDVRAMGEEILLADAELAKTRKERVALEYAAMKSRQQREIEYQRLEIEELEAKGKTVEAAKARLKLEKLEEIHKREDKRFEKTNGGAVSQYLDSFKTIGESIDDIMVGGFQQIENSISGLIDGTKSWGDVFRDVAAGVIADIAKIIIRQALIKPIAGLIGGGGNSGINGLGSILDSVGKASSGGSGLGGVATAAMKAISSFGFPKFHNGVSNFAGGLAIVGEGAGSFGEIVNLPKGSSVTGKAQTNNLLSKALSAKDQKAVGGQSRSNVTQNFASNIYADGVKTTEDLKQFVYETSSNLAAQAKEAAINEMNKRNRNRLS